MQISNGVPQEILFYMELAGSPVTGLTPATSLSKNAGALAPTTNSAAEVGSGWYSVLPTAAEVDTNGSLLLVAIDAGADTWSEVHQVVSAYDDVWNADLSDYPSVGSAGYTLNTLNQMISATTINIQDVFAGGVMNLRTHNTWEIPIDGLPDLSPYTVVLLVIKLDAFQEDVRAQLLVRSDVGGLVTIGGDDPVAAGNGTVDIQPDYRAIVATIDIVETGVAQVGEYQWWVRGLTATGGFDLMTGTAIIERGGTEVIS